jgi:hypothetical protein
VAVAAHHLVHLYIFSVELDATHAVANVGLPANEIGAKVVHEHGVMHGKAKQGAAQPYIFTSPLS